VANRAPTDGSESFESFGPYHILERLGVGGMATVHRAKKQGIEGFERVVALKRLLEHLSEDEAFIRSFVREARLASHLQHSNIVQIYDLGRVGHIYFIAMEHIAGQDLRMLLRQCAYATGPMPVPLAINLVMQLCDALDYAHNLCDESGEPFGIVHRDISPANVLLATDGTAKIIDFGIAKATSSKLLSQTGGIKGKFSYMPPEALTGEPLDARSDLFSLGVLAHELLTARPLFSGGSEFETMRRVQSEEVDPPSVHNPHCPRDVDEIVMHALAKTRDQRWQSASAMRAALDSVATRLGLRAANRDVAAWVKWAFQQPLGPRRWDADRHPPGVDEIADRTADEEVSEVSIVVEMGTPLADSAPIATNPADAPTIPPSPTPLPPSAPLALSLAPPPVRESAPYASVRESLRESAPYPSVSPNKTMIGAMVPVVAAPPAAGPLALATHPQQAGLSYDAQRAMMTVMPAGLQMQPAGTQMPPGLQMPLGMMPAYEPSGRPEFTPQTTPHTTPMMQPTLVPQAWPPQPQPQPQSPHPASQSQPVTSQKEYLAAAAVYNAQENAGAPGPGARAPSGARPVVRPSGSIRAQTAPVTPKRRPNRTAVWIAVIVAGAAAAAGGFLLVAQLRAKDAPGREPAPQAIETPAVPLADGTEVRLCVDAAGAVTSVETPLAADAVAALRRWRFAPLPPRDEYQGRAPEATRCFTTTAGPR
jgi:serine/threonine protein kinase